MLDSYRKRRTASSHFHVRGETLKQTAKIFTSGLDDLGQGDYCTRVIIMEIKCRISGPRHS